MAAVKRHRGIEIMPGRTELSKDSFQASGVDATRQLVKRAETKLVGLQANRSQLQRRIRALHYLLQTVFSASDSARFGLYPSEESKLHYDNASEFESSSDTTVTSRTKSKETSAGTPGVTAVSTELTRACRVALMESDLPQSCEQILQRIQRRESAYVKDFQDSMIAIAHELRKMMADGEVIQQKDTQLWQLNRDTVRMVGEHNSAANKDYSGYTHLPANRSVL